MTTSYEEIYSRFLPKITDYTFYNAPKEEVEDFMLPLLKSSIVNFRYCDKLGDRDDSLKQFNLDLSDEEQEILSVLMCVEYLTPKLLTDDLLKQKLNSKDYSLYSQANQIKEIRQVRDDFSSKANSMMMLYTYKATRMDGFKSC